jgi:hypothetical protein
MCTNKSLYNTVAYKDCHQEHTCLFHNRKVYYYRKTAFKCYKIDVTKIGVTIFTFSKIILSRYQCYYKIVYYTSGFRINLRPN